MSRQLKIDEVQAPAWWSAAVYERQPSGAWRFKGYTEPRWQTWGEFMQQVPRGETHVKSYSFRHTGATGQKWEQIF